MLNRPACILIVMCVKLAANAEPLRSPAPKAGAEAKWVKEFGVSTVVSSQGIRLASVAPGSVAARAGLKAGDHITEVNGQPVGIVKGLTFSLESEFRSVRGSIVLTVNDASGGKLRKVEFIVGDETKPPSDLPPIDDLKPLK